MLLSFAFLASFVTAAVVPDRSQGHRSQGPPQGEAYNPYGNLEGQGRSPICDKYASSLYGNNTVESQQTLMTVFVNRAMGGKSQAPNVGINVSGVIWPGEFHGVPVNLMGFFNGALNSTNTGAGHGVPVNWLDGGGAEAWAVNLPAFDTQSNQFTFITHLYEYFAYLLGCSLYGNTVDRYSGSTNMYETHRFMALDPIQNGYTILQFVLSGASLGFAHQDAGYIGYTLGKLFNFRCSPPVSIPDWAPPALQAMCTEPTCPLSPEAVCSLYAPVIEPVVVNSTAQDG